MKDERTLGDQEAVSMSGSRSGHCSLSVLSVHSASSLSPLCFSPFISQFFFSSSFARFISTLFFLLHSAFLPSLRQLPIWHNERFLTCSLFPLATEDLSLSLARFFLRFNAICTPLCPFCHEAAEFYRAPRNHAAPSGQSFFFATG